MTLGGQGRQGDTLYNYYPQTILWKNRGDRFGAPTAGGSREGKMGTGNQGEEPLEALFTLVCQRSASAGMHGRAAKLTQQKGAVAPWRQAGLFLTEPASWPRMLSWMLFRTGVSKLSRIARGGRFC